MPALTESVISACGLRKVFTVVRRAESGWQRLRSYLRPRREEVVAVGGIDLEVAAGEAVAFLGPNGAGKSTTIKMLTGILVPSAGEARVLGLVPWAQRQALAYRIGVVFGQRSQLWLHLPAVDTFNLLARIYDLEPGEYRRRREELVERFQLRDLLHVPVRKLSLGQRMRCELAAALLHRPRVLFLDEPTIGLDPVAKAAIRDLIRQANQEEGVTVFLTSHDAGDVERVCRRAVLIHQGRLLLDEPVSALRRRLPGRKIVSVRLGSPWQGLDLPGVEVLKAGPHGVKLAVRTGQVGIDAVVAELLRHHALEDLSIEDPPLEEVIADLYRAGWAGDAAAAGGAAAAAGAAAAEGDAAAAGAEGDAGAAATAGGAAAAGGDARG